MVGKGTFGKVYGAIINCDSTNINAECCAVKIIDKSQLRQKDKSDAEAYKRRFQAEMDIQSRLSHENIVHLRSCFQNDKFVFLEMELCMRNLYDYIEIQPMKVVYSSSTM